MRSVLHHAWLGRSGFRLRRRTAALALVLAAHALLVIMLLRLAPPAPGSSSTVTPFELIAVPQERARSTERPKPVRTDPVRRAPMPPAPPVPPAEEEPFKLDIIELTPREYAASHIAGLPSRPRAVPSPDGGEGGATSDSAVGDAADRGPNGERLYEADWYRKPTQAELGYYLPRGAPLGWGMVACQTVDDYRVDNCVELGESPAGSGLASAVNKAAWQFRVWPPRLGGRPLVGAWVRIRIEFTEDPVR